MKIWMLCLVLSVMIINQYNLKNLILKRWLNKFSDYRSFISNNGRVDCGDCNK